MVTVMSPEGKPIQVPANNLQMAGLQNSAGIYNKKRQILVQELSISQWYICVALVTSIGIDNI